MKLCKPDPEIKPDPDDPRKEILMNNPLENCSYFVGLQGSYGRGEATESSDIDIVVILDELTEFDKMSERLFSWVRKLVRTRS